MAEIKPTAIGPGSQPIDTDIGKFDYMEMPKSMTTFAMPDIPEPEDLRGMEEAKAILHKMHQRLLSHKVGNDADRIELSHLDKTNLGLVNQVMGEGEVAIIAGSNIQAQESVLAGVWRVHHLSDNGLLVRDAIEIANYPSAVRSFVFKDAAPTVAPVDETLPEGVFNAPPLLVEIADKVTAYKSGTPTHAINLTLLPQTEQDLEYLHTKLGPGQTTILSRGYGNCRVTSTGTKNVWWVQYFNSQDALILNSIEIVDVPEVVCAAQEDIDESAERLGEILEVYR